MKRVLMAAVLAVLPCSSFARTWTVGAGGADFPLIAPALAAAQDGDAIVVGAGVYRENLVLHRRVSIIGRGRPVLYGTGVGSVIRILADGCAIEGLTIEGSGAGESNEMDAAIQVASARNRIAGNVMRRVFYGVVIAGGSDNEVADNEIVGFIDLPFGRRGDGIYVYRAHGTRVLRNHVVGQRDAIYFQYAPGGIAERNTVDASRYALHVMFSNAIVVRGNTLRNSSVGANIMDSRTITLDGNRLERNRGLSAVGLTLKQCDDSIVQGNVIVDNARGLQVDGAARNRFRNNRFLYNDTALFLHSSSEQNTFARNVFDGNWTDVVITGTGASTSWSEDGRGNAWSSYQGFDFDADGIGDTPHLLLTPFAAIEGTNLIARLFLQTPAAAGLALAARAGFGGERNERDVRPAVEMVKRDIAAASNGRHSGVGLALLASTLGLLLAIGREISPC